MSHISIISKLTGVTNTVEASEITLNSPSIVELKLERSDIASITRSGQDMMITLRDGETITVKNFYAFASEGGNQLVLEGQDGVLWWVQDTDTAFHFEHINNLDELMLATGAHSEGGGAIWPWVLGGLAVAGGIGIAAASGGGGGGGGGSGDNGNGGGDGGNSGGNPDNPNPPGSGADTTPPAAPENLAISADGKTITGTAEPGSTVTIKDANGNVIGTGTAGSDGSFSIPTAPPQISGETLTAQATDPAGNTGPSSTVTAPNIPLPDEPTLSTVLDDTAPGVGAILNNQATNDNTPTLQGAGQAGTTVHIYDNGIEIGSVVVGENGTWSFTPGTPLSDGSHDFTVIASNAKGESSASDGFTITVDTSAPNAPVLSEITDAQGDIRGFIANNGVTDADKPALSGTGEARNTVVLFDNNVEIARVEVDANGNWSFTPTQPLAEGSHSLTLQQIDSAGNESLITTGPTFVIDLTPPQAVVILNVSPDGTTVTGEGEAGSIVTITGVNGATIGEAQVDSSGNWSITLVPAQTHGESLTAHTHDIAGNEGQETDFTASNSGVPAVPVLLEAIDNFGPIVGNLNNGQSSDDKSPVLNGTAESNSTVSIFDNGALLGTAIADSTGSWSFTPSSPLPEGSHAFTFSAANGSGSSGLSSSFTVVIDTSAPAAPGNLDVSDDGTSVTGGAEAGSKVTIFDSNGNPIGSATAGADGSFTVTISPAQLNGETLTATATDSAGNQGDPASVDAPDHTAPDAPSGLQVSTDGLHITGNAEAGSTIIVKDGNGNVLGTGTADTNGHFDITPLTPAQTNGQALLVTATDAATNTSPSATAVAPDSTAPDAPTNVQINHDGTTVTGSAEAGSTVKVTDINGNQLGSATAAADGTFSVSITPPQTNGQPLEVFATDPTGNIGPDTPVTAPDTTAPAIPAITAVIDDIANITGNISSGNMTNDDKPTLNGTAEANAIIKIYDNGSLLGTVNANASGNWNFTPGTALGQGSHNLTVTATDAAGNTSAPTAAFNIIVDSIAPLAPTITLVSDNFGSIIGPVVNGGVTNDSTPTISGTGEPGSTITLYNNGTTEIATLTVGPSGIWVYTPATPLVDGVYNITVTAGDAAGNVTPPSAVFTVTVDTLAPATPVFNTVTDDVGSIQNPLITGSSTDDTKPVINGSGLAGSTVTIYDNSTPIGTALVDAGGSWSFTPAQPLSEGTHNLSAIATDLAGNASGTANFVLTVDTTPPGAPLILSALGNVANLPATVPNGGSTQSGAPVLSGTGEPGATIKIYDNGSTIAIGTITVPANGNWTFTPGTLLGQGSHVLMAVATDAAGNTGLPSASFTLTVDNSPPSQPGTPTVTDDKTPVVGNITAFGSTNDTTPTFSGTGTAGDTIKIYNNGDSTPLGTTTVRADGSWSFTPATPLGEATYTITVTETDPAGNTSLPSSPIIFNVDTTAPLAPTIGSADDNVGGYTGTLINGAITDDPTPVFHGTGLEGDTITLYNNGLVIGTATVDSGGNWTLTPDSPLPNGAYNLTATQTDAAGNESLASGTFVLTVNSTPLTAPVVTEIVDNVGIIQTPLVSGSFTDDTTPTFTGTGTVGSTVYIYDAGTTQIGSATVGADGTWSITTNALGQGLHNITISATDAAGNNIGPSAPIAITVDTSPPASPVVILPVDDTGTLVTGTAEAGSTVIIKDALGNILGTGIAAPITGAWSVTLSPAQTTGETLTAIAQDLAGNQSPGIDFTAAISSLPHPPTIDHVVDDIGSVIGDIANGKATDDALPTLQGSNAAANATVNIFVDGVLLTSVIADDNGNWSFALSAPLSNGLHTFAVSQSVDIFGTIETSGQSALFSFTVDTFAPSTPAIVTVTDDVAPNTGGLINGQATNDPRPTLSGTGEAGATITILDNGTAIGTAIVNSSGIWTFTPTGNLANGSHPLTVTATDAAGNVSEASAGFTVNVDTVAPLAPVISSAINDVTSQPILSSQPTNDNTPTFSGSAEAGSTLIFKDGNAIIGTVVVPTGGNWTFTPGSALSEGSHNLTITATDAAGNVSPPSETFNVVVDTVAPVVPEITLVVDDRTQIGTDLPLTNGQLTKDAQPTLSGTSEANALITIKDGSTIIGTTTANASGAWSFTPGQALDQGSHTLTVTAKDAAGNTSNPSSSFAVVVDSVAPTAPLILTVTDNTAPSTGLINSGQATNETRPALTGSGEVGALITVYNNGSAIGTTTVGAGGSWSFTPTASLGNGSHILTVTATDAAGNISNASGGFTLLVDTTAPVAPVITTVADNIGVVVGDLSSGQATDDDRPTLSGSAEANTTVTIYDNGAIIGTALVDNTGGWSFTPNTALSNGSHALSVTTSDAAGNVSPPSGVFNIIVDTQAPTAPVVIQAFDDVGPVIGALVNGQTTNDTQPALSGTAEANSIVKIYDNGTFIGTVNASPTGTWSFTPGSALPDGLHSFTATSSDAAGNLGSLSANFVLTIDSAAPNTPQLTSVVDDVAGGVFNNPLANGQITNDARPTLNGSAEANSTVKIYDGSTQIGTATAGADGSWSFTPVTPLTTGSHTFTVTATDAAGNVSGATAGFSVVVDVTAPGTPLITSIIDDIGSITGAVGNGQPTNDSQPMLNGTAEAGSTVAIYDNGTLLATVTANGSGNWTYTPTLPLAQGNHTFTVTATDTAGNTSVTSQPSAIIVDTTPPLAPASLSMNGTGTVVTGTAEAGSTVTITSSTGVILGTAKADGTGSFSITISPAQTSGQALLAFAQDVAGNVGVSAGFSAPFTGVPGVPIISSVVDDNAPNIGAVANGQSTNDTTPTINGTAQAGATVSVYNNGVLMGTTTANASGAWSYTTPGLSEGTHAFTATATNANGTGSPSTAATVIVDITPPAIPTGIISADGSTITGTAEANSTVTITLPGGGTVTATANAAGNYSVTLPVRQIEGGLLSVNATDAAGNTSPSFSITAPTLPLSASSNVVDLALSSNAEITTSHLSNYGVLLVGALGNVASVLGSNTAQVGFTIADGSSGHITIDAAATGIVLSLLNTLEIAIQKYDSATDTWSTIIDSSLPQFANLLTLGASGIQLNVDNLGSGTYRVLGYNTSLLATGALTSIDVTVEQTGAGVVSGTTSHSGNVITDPGPTGGEDIAPTGTVVASVTNSAGIVVTVPVGVNGVDIPGLYGTLHINQDGSYTYTLNNTSAAVLGHTDNFTYTITHNGVSDSAQLVVTLGNGAPASTVTATDNTATVTYSTDVEAVNHGASQQTGLSVLGVGLGNVLSLNVLANMTNPIIFDVDDGSTRTMTLQASVGGVALLSTFDLYIYKFNDVTQQFEQYQVVKTWLTAPLLGGTSGQLTITLPGGEYLFLLNNASGVTVLTSYTLNILQDHTYAIDSVTASTTGNVMQDDVVPAGSHITQVNGVAIAASGTTTINGLYGTLTIDAQGNYTYTLKSGLGANSINTPDSFVYTVTAQNGDTGTASLNITSTPHTVDAVDDTSALMAVATSQNTVAYSDTSVGSASWTTALLAATHGNGSGTFVVDANTILHNAVLHFNIVSLLPLGGISGTWTLTDGAGTTRNGTFSGGTTDISLGALDLHAGTWTLSYVGNAGALSVGNITISPSVTGTTIDLDSYSVLSGSTVQGNLYDGSNASGAADQLSSVHTLMTITGYNGSTATLNPLTNSNASATIQGHYGTLQIGIDGSYTYTLNSGISPAAITSKETFNYTLNDQNGHSDSATLTINMNPQFVSTAQSDVITGSVYGDTLVYHLLNGTNATGGNGADVWHNFSLAQGDQINVHELLSGWNGSQSTLGNYLNVSTSGNNTVISIDRDGTGSTYSSTTLVTLENVHTTLDELVQQNHIVT